MQVPPPPHSGTGSRASRLLAILLGQSIRGRVARLLLLAGLVPLLGVAAYVSLSQRTVLSETANENLANHALLQAAAVERLMHEATGDIQVLASNPVLQSPSASRTAKSEQLREAQDFFEVFEDITLIDPQGNVIDSTTYSYYGSWPEKTWFQEALAGSAAISEVHRIPSSTRLVVVFTAPVYSEGEISAVVAGQMNMERVWEILDSTKVGETGFLVALDKHWNFISHPDKGLLLSRAAAYRDSPGLTEVTPLPLDGAQGQDLVGRMAPVGVLGWQVAALQESSETYALANDTIQKVMIAVAIVIMAAIVASFLLSKAITRPIRVLAGAMAKIAAGSLSERVPAARLGEIDQLSTSFNTMAANLEQKAVELATEVAERKRAEEQIRYLAYHDVLTGLPSRASFMDRLKLALAQARRRKQMLAVLFIDLDRFKLVNDTVGHVMGNRLLQAVGERLVALVREGGTVARLGGDEFTVVLPDIATVQYTAGIASRVLESFRRPWALAGVEFVVTASIGIAVYPTDGEDAESLLRNADIAMYQAKDSGRDNFQIFGPEMNARVLARVRLERELRRALETKEFVVYYQPQVNVDTGQILAMEALVRWQHPERGLVYPDDFIPLAEETGLIVPLGEWVLRTACAQNRAWQDARLPPLRVAVNLSARQFRQPGLVETLARTLEETGLGAEWLDLEITETTAMGDVEFSVEVLSRLREMGVHVCLDDFGTGYCSLAYLAQFPVDGVKIDRSFVRGLPGEPDSASIVAAILSLARSLNLRAVAEGVETEAQRALLLEYQCHEMQGYLFAKPATPEESEKLLASKQPLAAPAPSIGSRPVASRSTPVVDGASGATNKSKTRTAR